MKFTRGAGYNTLYVIGSTALASGIEVHIWF